MLKGAVVVGNPDLREAVGQGYDIQALRAAQALGWQAIERTAALVRPGMTEGEARACGEDVLAELGMERAWHPLTVRFGVDTLKIFSDRSSSGAVLGPSDIFFIDMGPVFGGHEADVGATFTTGEDPEMQRAARDVKVLYQRVESIWQGGAVVGHALYEAARAEAGALGWELNLDIAGHRVGDFPHSVHAGGPLGGFDAVPSPGLWILEIQIRHPTRPFGAFYEDLLA
jgi:Xaa-Pro aminopeptidase